MKEKQEETRIVSDRALEVIMRDVFDGMMELTLESAYEDAAPEFRSVELNPPTPHHQDVPNQQKAANHAEAEIINFPTKKRSTG